MPLNIDPKKIHIGDVVLVASKNAITEYVQRKLGYAESSKWTHVAGSIGGHDLIEGQQPKSRVCDIQKDYVDKGFEIKVMRRVYVNDDDRVKVALWWATLNNLDYDYWQLFWFAWGVLNSIALFAKNLVNSKKRLICSELITNGFYKQGYNLFDKPASNILPADFDRADLFTVVTDIFIELDGV